MNAPSDPTPEMLNDPAGRQLVEDIHDRKRLEGIVERLAKATPGPWAIEDDDGFGHAVYKPGGWGTMYICEGLKQGHDDGLNDAEFIANAPADVAYLLAELQQRNEALAAADGKVQELAARLLDEDIVDSLEILDRLANGALKLIGDKP